MPALQHLPKRKQRRPKAITFAQASPAQAAPVQATPTQAAPVEPTKEYSWHQADTVRVAWLEALQRDTDFSPVPVSDYTMGGLHKPNSSTNGDNGQDYGFHTAYVADRHRMIAHSFPVEESADDETSATDLALVCRAGGPNNPASYLYTSDSKFLLECRQATVRLYNVPRGALVSSFWVGQAITAAAAHPEDPSLVYLATRDLQLGLYNITQGQIIRQWTMPLPVAKIIPHPKDPRYLYLWLMSVSRQQPQSEGRFSPIGLIGAVVGMDLAAVDPCHQFSPYMLRNIVSDLALSPCGRFLAVGYGRTLGVWDLTKDGATDYMRDSSETSELFKPFLITHTVNWVSSLAFHPTEGHLAVGCQSGEILIYQKLQTRLFTKTIRMPLWHGVGIEGLYFSAYDDQLLSTSDKPVLLSQNWNSFKTIFTPHLGSIIRGFVAAPDHSRVAMVMGNGSIHSYELAMPRFQTTAINLRIQPDLLPQCAARYPAAGLQAHPITQQLMFDTPFASVQFYDPFADRAGCQELALGAISLRSGDPYAARSGILIEHFTVTRNGRWLAAYITLDNRNDVYARQLVFYHYCVASKQYLGPITRVLDPHQGAMTSMSFQIQPKRSTSPPQLVTTGADGRLRLWTFQGRSPLPGRPKKTNAQGSWQSRGALTYGNVPLTQASFSHDGSALIAASGRRICLWDARTLELQDTQTLPLGNTIQLLRFAGPGLRLIVQTADQLYLWDALDRMQLWNVTATTFHEVVVHPHGTLIATLEDAITGPPADAGAFRTRLNLYRADSPTPVATRLLRHKVKRVTFINARLAEGESIGKPSTTIVYPLEDRSTNLLAIDNATQAIDTDLSHVSLVAMTGRGTVLTFVPQAEDKDEGTSVVLRHNSVISRTAQSTVAHEQSTAAMDTDAPAPGELTLYSRVYGKLQPRALTGEADRLKATAAAGQTAATGDHQALRDPSELVDEMLRGPSHLLAPVHMIFDELVGPLVYASSSAEAAAATTKSTAVSDGNDVDEAMMVAEERSETGGTNAQTSGENGRDDPNTDVLASFLRGFTLDDKADHTAANTEVSETAPSLSKNLFGNYFSKRTSEASQS
ncbi:NET1-associated nuclear protein 1 [Tieghemiomyces parasiticus]|uniref:NET1-associated nuclear protein 1 n=1 Tax=Tieghemiomyces parasiticus TaxID=78921 RepID=A0A9W8AL78_9FUNG|nr:NET1-associated nuclear protein 1 [Tieghemiomyces parasiticus]